MVMNMSYAHECQAVWLAHWAHPGIFLSDASSAKFCVIPSKFTILTKTPDIKSTELYDTFHTHATKII